MEQKLEQIDKTVEIKMENPNVEISQSSNSPLVAKEEEPHPTHSFEWCFQGEVTSFTCNKARTVEDSLKQSPRFRGIVKKNKDKELVVLRDGKAISSHFPCSLIKDECLIVKYVKAVDKTKQPGRGSGPPCRKGSPDDLVTFHVLTKGGKDIVKMMRNPELRKFVDTMTVYAYKGEKVKQALRRDGRFLDVVFKKNCGLSHIVTEGNTEMSNLVDHLDGTTYKIILLNRCLPESQQSSLEDDNIISNASQGFDHDDNQNASQQPTTTVSVNDTPERKTKPAPELFFREMPESEKLKHNLSSQFKHLMKGKESVARLSRIQKLLRVEYGKNYKKCKEVKTMKKLMGLSDSVCQVRVNGSPLGSGFLLFDNFVLTNGHVVEDLNKENIGLYVHKLTVHFSFESLDQVETGQDFVVEEVAGSEYCSEQMHDWALLRLRANLKLPDCLLTQFGFCPQSNGICIIGHPDGGTKNIDTCFVIPPDKRIQTVEKDFFKNKGQVQLVTQQFFEGVAESVQRYGQVLTYNSCFYSGSSGSPVFDDQCRVVAMHSAGYKYPGARGETRSVIEFGYRLSDIMERIIIQLVERRRWDVLKAYLACSFEHQQNVMINVRKLVQSRNITAFTDVISGSEARNDESLKKFFAFFSQTEDPAPMDTE
ncbi:serine protease FAM111A-like isoform X3 [Scophthalmus maximus]|uniref:serine protease FAM111A-like isoform X3 n=1 Tax=Scophthalmus maximus TaxID=52904 RepID=UPI001FA93440|nr:serine protease FAM111A-like isoform X3 [Scophthalmus maximus]XP_047183813.1 serine protease FAM111A-like isoform X3 [Scophthalmus maximus]